MTDFLCLLASGVNVEAGEVDIDEQSATMSWEFCDNQGHNIEVDVSVCTNSSDAQNYFAKELDDYHGDPAAVLKPVPTSDQHGDSCLVGPTRVMFLKSNVLLIVDDEDGDNPGLNSRYASSLDEVLTKSIPPPSPINITMTPGPTSTPPIKTGASLSITVKVCSLLESPVFQYFAPMPG